VATADNLKQKRDAYVRMVAGSSTRRSTCSIRPSRRVAQIATVTGRTPKAGEGRAARFKASPSGPWDDGLSKTNLDAVVTTEKDLAASSRQDAGQHDRLVDRTIWKDASALVK